MNNLSASSLANTEGIALVAMCCLSAIFMVWFLVALFLDGIRIGRTENLGLHKHRPPSVASRVVSPPVVLGGHPGEAINNEKQVSSHGYTRANRITILSLSDKNLKNATKPRWIIMTLLVSATLKLSAQTAGDSNPTPAPQAPDQQAAVGSATSSSLSALATPTITGPLRPASPIVIESGPFGKLDLNGILSGMGLWQGSHIPGDNPTQPALSNGQVFVQKTSGWWQFYVQAGAYNILSLGTPFLSTEKAISDLYGPVPVAYAKLVPAKNTSILIGALPTLMGAEYTFDFQNMNIERGLLWNQENAINRGVQVNQTFGKFTASLSWNDGYYSNRYSWMSGSLTYANGPHSLSFIGMGNLGQTTFQTLATPVQNNSVMYSAIYTYTKGAWIVQPYYQYSNVPTNASIGVVHGASTQGGAVLVSHAFKHGLSLAGRGEYIASTGSAAENSVNLMYGPGSAAWSITLTPTFQYQRFFVRGDLSFVRATDTTPGAAFGPSGTNPNQPRGVMEVGFLF